MKEFLYTDSLPQIPAVTSTRSKLGNGNSNPVSPKSCINLHYQNYAWKPAALMWDLSIWIARPDTHPPTVTFFFKISCFFSNIYHKFCAMCRLSHTRKHNSENFSSHHCKSSSLSLKYGNKRILLREWSFINYLFVTIMLREMSHSQRYYMFALI